MVSCVELAESHLGGTDVMTTSRAALWYEQGEQSSLVICINSLAVKYQSLKRYRESHTFPKQRVECRGQRHMDKLCNYCVKLTCIYT